MKTFILTCLTATILSGADPLFQIYELSDRRTENFTILVEIKGHKQGYRGEKPTIVISEIHEFLLSDDRTIDSDKEIVIELLERDQKRLKDLTEKAAPGKIYLDAAGIIESAPFFRLPYESGPIVFVGMDEEILELLEFLERSRDNNLEQDDADNPMNASENPENQSDD